MTDLLLPKRYGIAVSQNGGPTFLATREMLLQDADLSVWESLGFPRIPEAEVTKWGIRPGDEIGFYIDTEGKKFKGIVSVWGLEEPEESLARSKYANLVDPNDAENAPHYPDEAWSIFDQTTDLGVRAFSLIAPLGVGSQAFLKGPFQSGKTRTSRLTVASLLEIAEKRSRMAFVVLQIGERRVDIKPMAVLIRQHPNVLVHHFVSILGETTPWGSVNTCEAALETVKRLYELGYDVIYVVDSLPSLATEAYGPVGPEKSPLTAGGISEFALTRTKRHVSVAGAGKGRSVTGIYTAIAGDDTASRRAQSIFAEAGGPQSSTIWSFGSDGEYPRIDVEHTDSREPERMLKGSTRAFEVYGRLRSLAYGNGAPKWYLVNVTAKKMAAVAGTFDQAYNVWQKWWEGDDARGKKERGQQDWQAIINLQSALERLEKRQALQALLQLLKNTWGDPSETLLALSKFLSDQERAALSISFAKDGIIQPEDTRAFEDRLLQLAGEARGQLTDPKKLLTDLGRKLGVDLGSSAVEKKEDPVELMLAVSARAKLKTGRDFGRRKAEELVQAGFAPEEVEERLLAGESPKELLTSGPKKVE